MIFQIYLISFCTFLSIVYGRGPHHPRGHDVVKHHVHYRPTKRAASDSETLLQDEQLLHDREHIREDVGEWLPEEKIDEMTDDELEFHYFQVHDFDNNSHLDGLEIFQAIYHTVDHEGEIEKPDENGDFNYYVEELIDKVLLEDDKDFDGYLSYPEYVAGKEKHIEAKKSNSLVPAPKLDS